MERKIVNVCAHCGRPIYEGDETWDDICGECYSAKCLEWAEIGEDCCDNDEYYDDYEMFL